MCVWRLWPRMKTLIHSSVSQGIEAFNARIENAQSLLDFKFNWLASQYDPKTVEGKSKIAQELLATIARFKSEVAKYELTKALAQKLNIPEGVLLKQAGQVKGQQPSFKEPEVEVKASASASGLARNYCWPYF